MFKHILAYELKHWLKNPSIYIYGMVFFGMALLTFVGSAGLFDGAPSSKINSFVNSPYSTIKNFHDINKVFLFLVPAIIGMGIYRDYQSDFHQILFSFPIKKRDYLAGKFISAFLITLGIAISVGFALFIGENFPYLSEHKIGPFRLGGFLQNYLLYTIPNLVVTGLIIFSIVLWTRNIFAAFTAILGMFFIQIISQNIFSGNATAIALSDPFAQNTFMYMTRYWSFEDQNLLMTPIENILIYNRLLWLGISGLIFGWTYRKFSLGTEQMHNIRLFPKSKKDTNKRFSLAQEKVNTQARFKLSNIFPLAIFHLSSILKNKIFIGLVLLGVFAIYSAVNKMTNTGDLMLYPFTRIVLSIPAFFFSTIILLLTFIYSGRLIHRERNHQMEQITDATATASWMNLSAKFLAVIFMQITLLSVLILTGIGIQLSQGFYEIELPQYFFNSFCILLPGLAIWAMASFFIHTIIPNPYVGMFILIFGWIGVSALPNTVTDHPLVLFNFNDLISYSDISGYGNVLPGFFLNKAYWAAFGFLLLIASYLLWNRGKYDKYVDITRHLKNRWKNPIPLFSIIGLVSFLTLGYFVLDGENEKIISSNHDWKGIYTEFQKDFEQYKNTPQAQLMSINMTMDIFPEENNFEANGKYVLSNTTDSIIDIILIKKGFDETTNLDLDRPFNILKEDKDMKFVALKLEKGLAPNDSIILSFQVKNIPNSIFERNSCVLKNGTLIQHDILPQIGYFPNIGKKEPSDSTARNSHYQSLHSGMIDYECVLSTSEKQTAITPGTLLKKWTEDGRNYFHYKMETKMKYSLGFNSGDYAVHEGKWNDVDLKIYHHKKHDYNLESMTNGLKAALDYNTKYFAPYPHKESNIIEFSQAEGTHATSYGTSIPMSEFDFIQKADTLNNKSDISFYIPAHELTHHWWGNLLTPGDALGASVLTESITEYVTLQIYKDYYGEEIARKFLSFQQRRYWQGRNSKQGKEPVLYRAKSTEKYLNYGKGTLVFHALSQKIGEDSLNYILKTFLESYPPEKEIYPTTLDFIQHLKNGTSSDMHYFIEDAFKKVITYDISIDDVNSQEESNGNFKNTIQFSIHKFSRKDTLSELNPLENIVISCYDEKENLIKKESFFINTGMNTYSIETPTKPYKIIIDENYLFIEAKRKDNEWIL